MLKTYTFEFEGVKCTLKRATIGDAIARDNLVAKFGNRPYAVALANFLIQTTSIEGDFPIQLLKENDPVGVLDDIYNKWLTVEEPFVVAWQNAQVKVASSSTGSEKKALPSATSDSG